MAIAYIYKVLKGVDNGTNDHWYVMGHYDLVGIDPLISHYVPIS